MKSLIKYLYFGIVVIVISCNNSENSTEKREKSWDINEFSVKKIKVNHYQNSDIIETKIIEDRFTIVRFILGLEKGIKTNCFKLPKVYEVLLYFDDNTKPNSIRINKDLATVDHICLFIDSSIVEYIK